ncbi:hypothetical protein HMPREF3190_01312 [Umbribacter vaginalis]|nr:hypothetical protein HMPREF3190_01312 [Coriobacteriales bacterium DNF00809]
MGIRALVLQRCFAYLVHKAIPNAGVTSICFVFPLHAPASRVRSRTRFAPHFAYQHFKRNG